MTKRSTKQALLLSVLSLILCVSMLIGSTFAWFTDSVTSSNNKIESGSLVLDLELLDKEHPTFTSIKNSKEAIFDYDKWEPGYVDAKILKVKNLGTLALKWVAQFVSEYELSILADAIDVYVLPGATTLPTRELTGYEKKGTLRDFLSTIGQTTYGTLLANNNQEGGDDEAYLGIALKMREDAGNIYQGLDLGGNFDIKIFATQLNSEVDSFDKDYDINSEFDGVGTGSVAVDQSAMLSAYAYDVYNDNSDNSNEKIAAINVPAGAIDTEATTVKTNIVASDYEANITVEAGQETKAFDITFTGLKENNDVPVKVELFIGEGLDPATVKIYHVDTLISSTYDPHTGYVTFYSATFSPFTVVYDAESEYVAPEIPEGATHPTAIVTYAPEYVGEGKVQWGSYGQWSPTEGLDSDLEAAFIFKCPEDLDPAVRAAFEYWYCDFYVSLDRDLGANEIFLGGYYENFGAYVGFHNGDVTLEANEELALLGSVTSSPWTYADVEANVATFMCGVGDVDDALEGATFTVKLRLTNPENESEFYDVNVVTYTFGGDYVIK